MTTSLCVCCSSLPVSLAACALLHCNAMSCVAMYCIILYYLVLYRIVLYCLALYLLALDCFLQRRLLALQCLPRSCLQYLCRNDGYYHASCPSFLSLLPPPPVCPFLSLSFVVCVSLRPVCCYKSFFLHRGMQADIARSHTNIYTDIQTRIHTHTHVLICSFIHFLRVYDRNCCVISILSTASSSPYIM